MTPSADEPGWGLYGFEVTGFTDPARLLVPAEPGWPPLVVERARALTRRRPDDHAVGALHWDEAQATMWLSDTSFLHLDRASMRVRFETEEIVTDDLVAHPYIALPAAVASHWLGRQVLHGASFLSNGQAWGVLGTREAGKSSTIGWLAAQGHPVVSDDLMMLEGARLFAGPRCVDLREATASVLGGSRLDVPGGRRRWRLEPPPVPSSAPLAGLIYLEWGDVVAVESVKPADRLLHLIEHSVLGPDLDDASAYLELATLPTLRLLRPQRLDALGEASRQLLDAIA